MGAVEQQLGGARGQESGDILCRKLPAGTPLNGAVALFVRCYRFPR